MPANVIPLNLSSGWETVSLNNGCQGCLTEDCLPAGRLAAAHVAGRPCLFIWTPPRAACLHPSCLPWRALAALWVKQHFQKCSSLLLFWSTHTGGMLTVWLWLMVCSTCSVRFLNQLCNHIKPRCVTFLYLTINKTLSGPVWTFFQIVYTSGVSQRLVASYF